MVGCAYENGDWQNIAIDVRMADRLDGTICHEIWHATESHILSRDYATFLQEDWEAMNPEGFTYYENTAIAESDAPWTLYSGSLEDVYFVDSYACVNAHEDRGY